MDLQILIIYELDFWLALPPSIYSHPDPQRTDFTILDNLSDR
jgi:hypothetical protein